MSDIIATLYPLLLPLLLGLAVVPVMQGLKKASTWLDRQSPAVKRIVVAGLGIVATLLAKVSPVPIPDNILNMNAEAVTALLTVLFSLLGHKIAKKPEA